MNTSSVLIVLIGISVAYSRQLPGSPKMVGTVVPETPPKFISDIRGGDERKFDHRQYTDWWTTDGEITTTKAPATTTKAPATTTKAPATTKPPTSTGSCKCGVSNPSRIVGGTEVNPKNKFFYQVGFLSKGSANYFCGGSVINKRYILTAAHCFAGSSRATSNILAVVGGHYMNLPNRDGTQMEVEKIIMHPDYDDVTTNNDVALVKLSKDLTFSATVSPVCLPPDDKTDYAGKDAIASGWGTLKSDGNQPDALQHVQVPVVTNAACVNSYAQLTDKMLCAGYANGGKDSCQGDSGGPLVVSESSQFIQVGVVSFGKGCALPGFPGVYARVSKFRTWILENTADSSYCNTS